MNWKSLITGKFYATGMVTFDVTKNKFNDTRSIGNQFLPAMFNMKKMLKIEGDAELLNNVANDALVNNLLLIQFDTAMSFLLPSERNFLIAKFDAAYARLKKLSNSEPTDGFVIVSPAKTYADYKNNNLFVYVVSNLGNDKFYFANEVETRQLAVDPAVYIYYIFNGVTAK